MEQNELKKLEQIFQEVIAEKPESDEALLSAVVERANAKGLAMTKEELLGLLRNADHHDQSCSEQVASEEMSCDELEKFSGGSFACIICDACYTAFIHEEHTQICWSDYSCVIVYH